MMRLRDQVRACAFCNRIFIETRQNCGQCSKCYYGSHSAYWRFSGWLGVCLALMKHKDDR